MIMVAILGGLTFLSVRHYKNYQSKTQAKTQQASKDAQQVIKNEQDRQTIFVNAFNNLRAECEKGLIVYNTYVPAASKPKVTAPVCGVDMLR